MDKRNRKGAIFAACLALVMLVSLLPAGVLAEAADPTAGDVPSESSSDNGGETGTDDEDTGDGDDENAGEEDEEESGIDDVETEGESEEEEETEASASSSSSETSASSSKPLAKKAGAEADLLDGLEPDTFDTAHLQWLVDNATGGTVVLEDDFTLDAPVTISKPLTLGGTQADPVEVRLTAGARHFTVTSPGVYLQYMNWASDTGAGGADYTGSGLVDNGGLQLTEITATGLAASGNGGVVCGTSADSQIELIACTFTGNSAQNGGAVYSAGEVLYDQMCLFDGNHADSNGGAIAASSVTSGGQWCDFTNNTAGGKGGAIYVDSVVPYGTKTAYIYGGGFTGNQAAYGGAIALNTNGRCELSFAELRSNTASEDGGAVWLSDEPSGYLYFDGCEITDNTARYEGGGVYGGNWVEFSNCLLAHNSARYGGGVFSNFHITFEKGTQVDGNTAYDLGGGAYNSTTEGIINLQHSTITNNTAQGDNGGGIYLHDWTYMYIQETNFANNKSARAAYWELANPTNENQVQAALRYDTTMVGTPPEATKPFDTIYNCYDVSFFFETVSMYQVTLEPNGTWPDGSTTPKVVYVEEGGLVSLSETGEPYEDDPSDTPVGWYTDPGLTKRWDLGTSTVSKDVTLYAKYATDYYPVTFYDADGGVLHQEDVEEHTKIGNRTPPGIQDMEFEGWYSDKNLNYKWDFDNNTVEGKLDLYPRYVEDDEFDAVYMVEDREYYRECNLDDYSTLTPPTTDPEKDGSIFAGWYLKDADEPWDFSNKVDEDIVLYARFVDDGVVSVTYYLETDDTVPYQTESGIPEGNLLRAPEEPEEEGLLFDGWFTDKDLTSQWLFYRNRIHDDTVLYARWVPAYEAIFVVEGDVYLHNKKMRGGALLTEPGSPLKEKHTFAGWYRGTLEDLPEGYLTAGAPTVPLGAPAAGGIQPLAADPALVFWLFDTDPMPEETLVLVASFDADAAPTPPGVDPAASGGGTGDPAITSSPSSSGAAGTGGGTGGGAAANRYGYRGYGIAATGDAGHRSLFSGLAALALVGMAYGWLRKKRKHK